MAKRPTLNAGDGQVKFPPDGVGRSGLEVKTHNTCMQVDHNLTITFEDAGIFEYFPPGHFRPKLPTGPVLADREIVVKATKKPAIVFLFFHDLSTGILYVEILTIQVDPCPAPKKKPKLKTP